MTATEKQEIWKKYIEIKKDKFRSTEVSILWQVLVVCTLLVTVYQLTRTKNPGAPACLAAWHWLLLMSPLLCFICTPWIVFILSICFFLKPLNIIRTYLNNNLFIFILHLSYCIMKLSRVHDTCSKLGAVGPKEWTKHMTTFGRDDASRSPRRRDQSTGELKARTTLMSYWRVRRWFGRRCVFDIFFCPILLDG